MQFEKLQADLQTLEKTSNCQPLCESIRIVFDTFLNHYHRDDIFFE